MKIIENERQEHGKQFAFCKQIRKKERSQLGTLLNPWFLMNTVYICKEPLWYDNCVITCFTLSYRSQLRNLNKKFEMKKRKSYNWLWHYHCHKKRLLRMYVQSSLLITLLSLFNISLVNLMLMMSFYSDLVST